MQYVIDGAAASLRKLTWPLPLILGGSGLGRGSDAGLLCLAGPFRGAGRRGWGGQGPGVI
jgi:hypothetical protein